MAQQAVALDDSLAVAHSVLASVYGQQGQNDQAVAEAERAIALDPNSASGYFALAHALIDQFKLIDALAAIDNAIRLDPRNSDNYLFVQGYAYTHLGRWNEAVADFKRYLVHYPDFLWAHVFATLDYDALGDSDDAQAETAEIERAIAANPNSAMHYFMLALALNNQGRAIEALVAADKAVSFDPHNSDGYTDLYFYQQGRAYTLLGRSAEAIPAIKPYLVRDPNDFWARAYLAADYMELGQDDAGRAEVAEILRLDPQLTVDTFFPVVGLQHKALPAQIDRFRADLLKAGLK
jgi:tetratricopeptide (TPR) repeat protein